MNPRSERPARPAGLTARAALVAATVAILATAAPGRTARAWETTSTHANLTEQAALASRLHAILEQAFGLDLGWYGTLTLAPRAMGTLTEYLGTIPPASGAAPDARGNLTAIGWLVAGSIIEDQPVGRDRNHFYDPVHRTGLAASGAMGLLDRKTWGRSVPTRGMAAPDWIVSRDNELGLAHFLDALEVAATAKAPADRRAGLARALLTAGALLHVLEDAGSPPRARNDLAEFLQELDGCGHDRGSRLERLATLLYGATGIPGAAPAVVERRAHLRDYFTAADGRGLSDVTAARWYSIGTLPRPVAVPTNLARGQLRSAVTAAQPFPLPRPERDPSLTAARSGRGGLLRDADGVCLARYREVESRLVWDIPDECAGEQLAALLPDIGAYAAGFLDHLFRGTLGVSAEGVVTAGTTALGRGTLRVFVDDAAGNRTPLGAPRAVDGAAAGAELARVEAPAAAARLIVVFRGLDAAGEGLVGVGAAVPAPPAPPPPPPPPPPEPTPATQPAPSLPEAGPAGAPQHGGEQPARKPKRPRQAR